MNGTCVGGGGGDAFDQTLKWSRARHVWMFGPRGQHKSPELWRFKEPFRVAEEERRTSTRAYINTVAGTMRESAKNKTSLIH